MPAFRDRGQVDVVVDGHHRTQLAREGIDQTRCVEATQVHVMHGTGGGVDTTQSANGGDSPELAEALGR